MCHQRAECGKFSPLNTLAIRFHDPSLAAHRRNAAAGGEAPEERRILIHQ